MSISAMPLPLKCALAGASLGLFDTALIIALGVEMQAAGYTVTLPVMALFTVTYGALGFVIGRLLEAQAQLRADRETIRGQVQALEAAQERLVQSEKLAALGRMAASVAHEVRNPLAVIRSSAALLGEDLPPGGDAAEAASFITGEVDRLDAYVTRILDHARPLSLDRGPVQLDEICRQATLRCADLTTAEISGAAPALVGDADLLVRLVLGLLTNAVQAGARRVELVLGGEARGAWLEIRDDGPGIPSAERAQIFEPFFTTRAQGTGLGLAIARRIAEAHGGTLELRARSAPGALFCLTLPVTP